MLQAMEILQWPLLALQERIDQELIANPVLEIRQDSPEASSTETDEEPAPQTLAESEQDLVVRDAQGGAEDFERLSNLADRWDSYFDEAETWQPRRRAAGEADPKLEAMQNAPDEGQTLQQFLLGEWHLEDAPERVARLGDLIIRNLDDGGYLRVALEELAKEAEPPASLDEMEEVLWLVQHVGPSGIAARSLEECLLLQLAADPSFGKGAGDLPENTLEVRLIRGHLKDIEQNRYPQMAKALGVGIEEVKRAVERICRLNPHPGTAITAERTPPIIPDVRITWDDEAAEWRVTVERGGVPQLYISRAYRRLARKRDLDEKTRSFVARNLQSARWLLEAIEQRRDSLERVVRSIVKFQRPFFDEGPDQIRPLKMQEVADDVHLHVATVSRAAADKYADTPWGICPLRDFFTGGMQNAQGEDVAWDHIRQRLKALVDAEDKHQPLADDQLAERLRAEGLQVARRTVAKYREELGISSSRKRRQY
jgi:RNA polymerase sigma-54 factor